VHKTSLMLGLMKTLYLEIHKRKVLRSEKKAVKMAKQ
jgi:hypothetical protein